METPPDGDRREQEVDLVDEIPRQQRVVKGSGYLSRFWPGRAFRSATKSATSPVMMLAFDVTSVSVVEATYFGMPFIRLTKSLASIVG